MDQFAKGYVTCFVVMVLLAFIRDRVLEHERQKRLFFSIMFPIIVTTVIIAFVVILMEN